MTLEVAWIKDFHVTSSLGLIVACTISLDEADNIEFRVVVLPVPEGPNNITFGGVKV